MKEINPRNQWWGRVTPQRGTRSVVRGGEKERETAEKRIKKPPHGTQLLGEKNPLKAIAG